MAPIYPEAPTRWCSSCRTGSVLYTAASWMPLLDEKGAAHVQRRPAWYFIKIGHYVEDPPAVAIHPWFTFNIVSALDIALRFRDSATASSGSGLCWNTVRALRDIYRLKLMVMWRELLSLTRRRKALRAVTLCTLPSRAVFLYVLLGCVTILSYQTAFFGIENVLLV